MATGKIWISINLNISPDGDGAKAVLTKPMVAKIEKDVIERTMAALPGDKYSNKPADEPKGKRDDDAARAIRIVEELDIKVETKGSKLAVGGTMEMTVELIRSAKGKRELAGVVSKGREIENRGKIENKFDKFLAEILDHIVGPLAEKLIVNPQFESFAKARGLPL